MSAGSELGWWAQNRPPKMIRCLLSAPRAAARYGGGGGTSHHTSGRIIAQHVPRTFSGDADIETGENDTPPTSPPPDAPKRKKSSQRDTFLEELPVTFSDISRANVAIRTGVKRTPCIKSFFLSELVGANIFLKTEFQQFTGSFKERGARNAILTLLREHGEEYMRKNGVIAASAGNHALALAYHGKDLNVPVTVVMPVVAPLAKVDKCRKFGAHIIIHGAHIGEAKEHAEELILSSGLEYVNGYDDPPIIAGAGTIGIEIIEDVPCVDAVVVPVGGGGLIAGIGCAVKTLKPDVKVFGVEPFFAASYTAALKAGQPVNTKVTPTLADGLAVPMVGSHAFEVARHYVDECVLCTEKEVSLAILRLIENEKMVVEGGGATGLAALLPGAQLDRHGERNNIDSSIFITSLTFCLKCHVFRSQGQKHCGTTLWRKH